MCYIRASYARQLLFCGFLLKPQSIMTVGKTPTPCRFIEHKSVAVLILLTTAIKKLLEPFVVGPNTIFANLKLYGFFRKEIKGRHSGSTG